MQRYIGAYYEEIKKKLVNIGYSENLEIYTFTNDANQKEFYIQDYSDFYQSKTLTKVDKRIIYQIILGILEQQRQNGYSR